MNFSDWPKKFKVLLLGVGFFAFGFILQSTGLLNPLERVILDYKFRYLQREDPNDKIVMVAIDERSLNYFNQNRMYWPWPRDFYAAITDYFNQAGAEEVVFDILFDTPDFDRRSTDGEASDNHFAAMLDSADNAILAFKSTPAQGQVEPIQKEVYDRFFGYDISGLAPYQKPHIYTSLPIEKFASSSNLLGNTYMDPDDDGVIRKINFFDSLAYDGYAPTLAMAAYLATQPDSITFAWKDQGLRVGDRVIPLQDDGSYLINWYKKGGVREGTFPYYSFQAVIRSLLQQRRNPDISDDELIVPSSVFEDKVVFVGASAAGLSDIKSTPLSSLEEFPGMEIHANVLNNLIDGKFITQLPYWQQLSILFLLTFGISFLIAYTRPMQGVAYIFLILIAIVATGLLLFNMERIWFHTGMHFVIGALTYTGAIAFKYFSEEREKKQIKSAFGQYVQPEFVEKITDDPELLQLGGEKKELTVMFSDLAGFTTISESMPPEHLVAFLNEYLGAMTDIIFQNGGTVDKFIGDAIMAFWGAPIEQNNNAILACRSTLQMIDRLNQLAPKWVDEGKPYVFARYGINTGPMVVGNMGSDNRFNYTVLGDAVNLAARLEPANKEFDTTAMISEFTYSRLNDEFICRQLDMMIVKGKTKPVRVYELMADRSGNQDYTDLEKGVAIYRDALRYYYDMKWQTAIDKFEKVIQIFPDDGPSQTYIERSKQFMANPPDEDWDGVYRMLHK
ncbi:MAG: CHASE2 domain-containing protein [Bacteroidota bacterium]